jgi:small subunit ribosomal protein S13
MVIFFSKYKYRRIPAIQVVKTVYGVNFSKALLICRLMGLVPSIKFGKVPKRTIIKLEFFMSNHMTLDRTLRQKHLFHLAQLRDIRNWKSARKSLGLPANGQRSKTNAQTAKKFKRKQKIERAKASAKTKRVSSNSKSPKKLQIK